MNIEKIKQLSNEDLGRAIAEKVGFKTIYKNYYRSPEFHQKYFIELCTDLNAIAEVEKIVTTLGRPNLYISHLAEITGLDFDEPCDLPDLHPFATASARQRAEAILLTLQR